MDSAYVPLAGPESIVNLFYTLIWDSLTAQIQRIRIYRRLATMIVIFRLTTLTIGCTLQIPVLLFDLLYAIICHHAIRNRTVGI